MIFPWTGRWFSVSLVLGGPEGYCKRPSSYLQLRHAGQSLLDRLKNGMEACSGLQLCPSHSSSLLRASSSERHPWRP